MNLKTLERRIMRLKPCRLIVLAEMPDGTHAEMTVDEMIAADAGFIRVIAGNELDDLDKILNSFYTADIMDNMGA